MIRGIYTAAAAMAAELAKQDVLANNLANLNTTGFKEDMAIFKARSDQTIYRFDASGGARSGPVSVKKMGALSTGVYLDEIATRMDEGQLRPTGEPLDLALSSSGFFVVRDGSGQEFLTRGGSFQLDSKGNVVDDDGRTLMTTKGPLHATSASGLHIDKSGNVSQDGNVIGTLRRVEVNNVATDIQKLGGSIWGIKNPKAVKPTTKPDILQGYLEASNVNPMREIVEMIDAQRTYEASQKMVTAQDETLSKAVNDIGRV